jgi:hypothetical protein
MLRFLLRVAGFLSWVGAVALIIVDGTRSIAANELETLSLSALLGDRLAFLAARLGDDHPSLWHIISVFLTYLPSSLFFIAVGALALWLGQTPSSDDGLVNHF